MHKKFDHRDIEQKWQERWREEKLYETPEYSDKPKAYILDMFPYPSGEGLHVGHPKGYIATDIYSRFKKMTGHEVLHPMGWDAFGLPAENYAIKNKVHPREAVEKNVARFKEQLQHLGFNYDWSREVNTTDPHYYKWTQWIFLKLLEKGLAFQSYEPINWCPSCQTGLANEDLEDGKCERCGSEVEQRPMRQWVLRITDYADRLLNDLETLPQWPSHIKDMQRAWIGRSEGAEIEFAVADTSEKIKVFTTRPDTLFGATYMVLAPEHPLVETLAERIDNIDDVRRYVQQAQKKGEIERTAEGKEKTGVQLEGITAINPANHEEIPVFVADYVLGSYGTGAIMAVPAHDERDYAFAQKYNVQIKQVILPCKTDGKNPPRVGLEETEREMVAAFLRNNANGKWAVLRWHGALEGACTGILGGIEKGMTPEEAVLTEIREETGLQNARIIKQLEWMTSDKYCAAHKGVNRTSTSQWFICEVDDLSQQQEIDDKEKSLHSVVWIEEDAVLDALTSDSQKRMWAHYKNPTPLLDSGTLINSGEFDGMDSEEAKTKITEKVGGKMAVTYKLRDWVFSRQRYWGEPIPVVHCGECGVVPVPESDLPVVLPEVEHYEPTGTGESPLADITEWVNTTCPICGGSAKRETNTMPQWAGSCWYYLRFIDPENHTSLVDPVKEKYWMPVDVYVGGAEHATRHLIYARFWHKFLHDIGVVSTTEPFTELHSVGLIMAEDGRKMSKRYGNVINPDDIVARHGADTLRVYEMFMGPFDNAIAWDTNNLVGAQRFLERVYGLAEHIQDDASESSTKQLHKTVQKVTDDIAAFKFNTAISALMIFVNTAEKEGLTKESYETFLRLIAPFAPHLADELWEQIDYRTSIHTESWPVANAVLLVEDEVTIAVQINGKVRGTVTITPDAEEETVIAAARAEKGVAERLADGETKKVIYVPGKIINFIQ